MIGENLEEEESLFDSFEVGGTEVEEMFQNGTLQYERTITTETGNHYNYYISLKGDEHSKLKNLKIKIAKKDKVLKQLKQTLL
jgi:hypothetical protein